MPYDFYKVLHLSGLILLFMGLGAMFFGPRSESGRLSSMGLALHGIGALILIVAGFGLHARTGGEWAGWLFAKIGIWVLIGGLPFVVKRKFLPSGMAWILAVALGIAAAWLAVYKPM